MCQGVYEGWVASSVHGCKTKLHLWFLQISWCLQIVYHRHALGLMQFDPFVVTKERKDLNHEIHKIHEREDGGPWRTCRSCRGERLRWRLKVENSSRVERVERVVVGCLMFNTEAQGRRVRREIWTTKYTKYTKEKMVSRVERVECVVVGCLMFNAEAQRRKECREIWTTKYTKYTKEKMVSRGERVDRVEGRD